MSKLISVRFTITGDEPVSLDGIDEAKTKDWIKVDFPNDDPIIEVLIKSARQKCEKILGLVLIDTTVNALYRNNGDLIELFYGPIKTDEDGLPIIDGVPDGDSVKGWDGNIWIESTAKELNLTYESGWDEFPEWAKKAIWKQVAWDYRYRGDDEIQYVAQVNQPIAPETLEVLNPYRINMSDILL